MLLREAGCLQQCTCQLCYDSRSPSIESAIDRSDDLGAYISRATSGECQGHRQGVRIRHLRDTFSSSRGQLPAPDLAGEFAESFREIRTRV